MAPSRTQLNVNINPELLKILKQNSIKSGMTLANYVTQLIKVYVSKEDILENEDSVNSRINNIEQQLKDISAKLSKITESKNDRRNYSLQNKITGFSKDGSKAFCDSANQFFSEECKKRNLTIQEALIEITPLIQSSFKISYWGNVIEMFAENKINASNVLMYKIYNEHGGNCPLTEVFHKWTGKKAKLIEKKMLEAAIYG